MPNASKIALLKNLIETAQSNLNSARQIITDMCSDSGGNLKDKYGELAAELAKSFSDDNDNGEGKVIEGVFDGQNMVGPNGKVFPVPANYASKSKLVEGDILKLSISNDGSFTYKQIGPVPRKHVKGPLMHEGNQYFVLAESKNYKVLLASITYFHGETGDDVTLLVPELEESEWGAIENIIPKIETDISKGKTIEEVINTD